MPKEITLPEASDLSLVIDNELQKLPTDALHNHFHQLSERASNIQEEMSAVSLSSLILCALELDDIQKGKPHRRSGLPFKKWVQANCDFSYMTATKYAKALRCVREGMLPQLDPALLPDKAPSQMSKDELADTCRSLSESLRGLGGRRQLYLQLDIISLAGGKKDNSTAPKAPTEEADVEAIFFDPLQKIGKLFSSKKHLKLSPPKARELEAILLSYLDDLKLIK